MDKYRLPTSVVIGGVECEFRTDYRDIIYLFEILTDPDLLENERVYVALGEFYKTDDYEKDIVLATKSMFEFMTCGEQPESNSSKQKPLYDWDQDFNLIVAPINKGMGTDIRGMEYLHWWTFLSAFMDIGECTFSTYVGIRYKRSHGIKLDKSEEKLYNENRGHIDLKKKYDKTTQAYMNEILGKEM